MVAREKDTVTGTETTGHEWDGIKELNTPLPRWWILTFYACIAFAVIYMILYPAVPLLKGATPGLWNYSSRTELKKVADASAQSQANKVAAVKAASFADILKSDELRTFTIAAGAANFKVNCVQCHGSGAAGAIGYPNLNDNDWIWGGNIEAIHQTIAHGVNFESDDKTRTSQMTVFGPDPANDGQAILTPAQIVDVANFTVTLGKAEAEDQAAADRGKTLFAENCANCHGDIGEGKRDMGALNLSDAIWLYSRDGGVAAIARQVTKPRHGVMPAWITKLDEVRVKELAVYVYSLGGGEAAAQ